MDEISSSEDRRRFQRILFDAPVTLDFNNTSHNTSLIDISLKGALVKSSEEWQLDIGSQLSLTIPLGGAGTVIQMYARVAHTEAGQVGFICDEIDMQSITHLRRLVELNLGEDSLLERDLQALG